MSFFQFQSKLCWIIIIVRCVNLPILNIWIISCLSSFIILRTCTHGSPQLDKRGRGRYEYGVRYHSFCCTYEFLVNMKSYFSIINMNSYFWIISIHISDWIHLSPFIKQAIIPEKWNSEKSLKTDMKYIEKFWNHSFNIVFDFWRIILRIPYHHPIIFRTLNTAIIFPFIKVLVTNVQALFQNCILDFQFWSKRRRLQC